MYCKMTQNVIYYKILNIIHGVEKNVSLDLVYYLPVHKPYFILIVQRNNCFEMIRNVKLKMLP